jgi:hypothetical protein
MRYLAVALFAAVSVSPSPLASSGKAEHPKHAVEKKNPNQAAKPPAALGASTSLAVAVTGSLSANLVSTKAHVSGFVTIANGSNEPLTQMRLLVHVPDGFSFLGARVEQDQPVTLQCDPVDARMSVMVKCDVPGTLPKGAERAITLEWNVETDEPQQSVDVTVEWLAGATDSGSSRSLSLGELSSASPWKLWVAGNPLFLPLLTGVLGGLIVAVVQAWLASRQKSREYQRAQLAKLNEENRARQAKIDEEGRASKARKLEEERTHKVATWDLMLPQSHQLATQHYVHMQSFVNGAISSLQRYETASKPSAPADPEIKDLPLRSFLYLLLFARRMQYSTDTVGALYFKNRTAEEIVSRCYYVYRKLYFDRSIQSRGEYEAILRGISPKARVSDLYEKLNRKPGAASPAPADTKALAAIELGKALQAAFAEFDTLWIQGAAGKALRAKIVPVLDGFASVLQFEMNRPYRYWYNEPSLLEIGTSARTAIETLGQDEAFGKNDNWDKFRADAKIYLDVATTLGSENPVERELSGRAGAALR